MNGSPFHVLVRDPEAAQREALARAVIAERKDRCARIDALAPDRSRLPRERDLPASPPEALLGEERIRRKREAEPSTRFEALDRIVRTGTVVDQDGRRRELREPIPVKPEGRP